MRTPQNVLTIKKSSSVCWSETHPCPHFGDCFALKNKTNVASNSQAIDIHKLHRVAMYNSMQHWGASVLHRVVCIWLNANNLAFKLAFLNNLLFIIILIIFELFLYTPMHLSLFRFILTILDIVKSLLIINAICTVINCLFFKDFGKSLPPLSYNKKANTFSILLLSFRLNHNVLMWLFTPNTMYVLKRKEKSNNSPFHWFYSRLIETDLKYLDYKK